VCATITGGRLAGMAERTVVDAVVLGLGPGGEDVAGRLAEAGWSVVGIDKELVGGECPYWGCIPSKMIIRAAETLAEARRVDDFAGHASVEPDWAPVARRIRQEATDTWNDQVAVDRLVGKGVTVVKAPGRVLAPGVVEADGVEYEATRALVVATGSSPAVPPIEGLAGTPYWTNRGAIEAETAPESLVVLGGGAIGLELAQGFARFGTQVSVVEAGERILALEEPEASEVLAAAFAEEGITVATGAQAQRVTHDGSVFTVSLGSSTGGDEVTGVRLLVATGRRVDLAAFGAASLGIDESARALEVDEHCRVVGAERAWALGDVTGRGAFTHVSMYQAGIVLADLLGRDRLWGSYQALPRVTFTDPEVGAVGLTERQARESGIAVATATSDLSASTRGWIAKARGVVKLVADRDRGVLVGGTVVGPYGGEVMSALAVAVAGGVPLRTLRGMIWAYPTFHRAIEATLAELDA
jgi:pyruvate/2-oxoglutarate dehydrogenase complex dihydrolipoamide dehydrogenase (E3) component